MNEQKLVADILKDAKADLVRTHGVIPKAIIQGEDVVNVIIIDPKFMDSGAAKDALFDTIREQVQALKAWMVIFLSDMFVGMQTPEQMQRTRIVELVTGPLGVEQRYDLGLSTKRECIGLSVQTPTRTYQINQYYVRDGDGIRFEEEQIIDTGNGMALGGRMSFFRQQGGPADEVVQ